MKANKDYMELRLQDFLSFAQRDGVCLTRFLDVAQQQYLQFHKGTLFVDFFGGYPEAERKRALILREKPVSAFVPEDFRIHLLFAGVCGELRHRDVLGAAMALGIKRELLGDILVRRGGAYLFCDNTAAPFLKENLRQAGNCALRFRAIPPETAIIPPEEFLQEQICVNSLRVDCVAAALCRCPRAEIQQMLMQGLVKVNHVQTVKPEMLMAEGDIISIRHHGRFLLEESRIAGRKNKFHLAFRHYF